MDEKVRELLAVLAETPGKNQRLALETIAAYAYGMPTQPVAGEDGGPVRIEYEYVDEWGDGSQD
jgi:hypothetical protein